MRGTAGFWYGSTDGGLFKADRTTGELTALYLVGDDDEDFTTNMWFFEWPTFTVSASVTFAPSNTLNVLLYDQSSGQRLREQEVTSTETIPCFTNAPKFLVCRSPSGASNYQIAAHMTPTATA